MKMKQHEIFLKTMNADVIAPWQNKRIAAIHEQLQLPTSMPKVTIPFTLIMLQRTGENYSQCPHCKAGKMARVASYLQHNCVLVNVKELNRQRTRNKASPKITATP